MLILFQRPRAAFLVKSWRDSTRTWGKACQNFTWVGPSNQGTGHSSAAPEEASFSDDLSAQEQNLPSEDAIKLFQVSKQLYPNQALTYLLPKLGSITELILCQPFFDKLKTKRDVGTGQKGKVFHKARQARLSPIFSNGCITDPFTETRRPNRSPEGAFYCNSFILQIGKLRPKEVDWLSQGYGVNLSSGWPLAQK